MTCPECKGTGKITLFTSVIDCDACEPPTITGTPQAGENFGAILAQMTEDLANDLASFRTEVSIDDE